MKIAELHLVPPLVLLALLAGCATDRQVIHQADEAHSELEPSVMDDAQLRTYMQDIGERVVAAAKEADAAHRGPKSHFVKDEDNSWMFRNDEFHLVNSKTLNAFTTGGEHMYLYSELLKTCRSEDELAAVVSHEFAHVYCRHVQQGMNRQYIGLGASVGAGLVGFAVGGKKNGEQYGTTAFVSASLASTFLQLGYTRADEAQADEWGFEFYTRAGWDPDHFGDFFQQLIDKGYDKTPEMTSDHPSLSSRVKAARQRAAALPPEAASWRRAPVADLHKFAAIQNHAEVVSKSMANSDEVAKAQTLLSAVPSCLLPVDQPEQKDARKRLAQGLQSGPRKSRP